MRGCFAVLELEGQCEREGEEGAMGGMEERKKRVYVREVPCHALKCVELANS